MAPSANDDFTTPFEVTLDTSGDPYVSEVDMSENTYDENYVDIDYGPSAWWTYTPIESGTASFDTELTYGYADTILTVFTGEDMGSLVQVAQNDENGNPSGNPYLSTITGLPVEANTTYRIQVMIRSAFVPITLRVTGPPTPIDDTNVTAPPITVSIGSRNALFIDAEPVTIAFDGEEYISEPVSNVDYVSEQSGPDAERSAWWRYTPASDGLLTLDVASSTNAHAFVNVFLGNDLLTLLPLAGGGQGIADLPVTAGMTYRIMVHSAGEFDNDYVLYARGPGTVDTFPAIYSQPIEVSVEGSPQMSAGTVRMDAPPIEAGVKLDVSFGTQLVIIPPIQVGASVRAPTIRRIRRMLSEPANSAVLPVRRPTFSVGVNIIEGTVDTLAIDVQVDDNPGFTSPFLINQPTFVLPRAFVVSATAPLDLPDGVHYWRARTVIDGDAQQWTTARTFTIDPTSGDTSIELYWTPIDGPTDPQLWSLDPQGGQVGQAITMLGVGFPDNGTAKINNTVMPIPSSTRVPATPAAFTDDRIITDTYADCEHDEVVALIPDVPPPGGGVKISGDDGA